MKNINKTIYANMNADVAVKGDTWRRSQLHMTTMNPGKLVPLFCDEILPGDMFDVKHLMQLRVSSALLKPVLQNFKVDLYAFFVPTRLLIDEYEQFFSGRPKVPDWSADYHATLPQFEIKQGKIGAGTTYNFNGSFWDYIGVPRFSGNNAVQKTKVSALPLRAYYQIWNDWFRDENLQKCVPFPTTMTPAVTACDFMVNNSPEIYDCDGKVLCPVNKLHDVFTSALPSPQYGAPVTLGLAALAPVVPIGTTLHYTQQPLLIGDETSRQDNAYNLLAVPGGAGKSEVAINGIPYQASTGQSVNGSNLYADLTRLSGVTINDLRLSFQTQLWKEINGRMGGRYCEVLRAFFGVVAADSRLQRAELLANVRFENNIEQVAQLSQSTETSKLGDLAGYSRTIGTPLKYSKAFVEHGYLMVLACVRIPHVYSQGLPRYLCHVTKDDFYWTTFAHLGEVGIKNKEIKVTGDEDVDEEIFGYNERYYEYKYLVDRTSSYMSPHVEQSMAIWNYADNYRVDNNPVTLSEEWMYENALAMNRSLAVDYNTSPAFIVEFYSQVRNLRKMPLHGYPGLIDHAGRMII